eukprot:CAMPEP_0174346698 /NCGR_PEP_ID=MMETSP0811_2-20130205/2493_1 /TAXON_ID=73025 ORGANISM="Eutreptiella gymnastica-like, Strain CCMP1594" /NCGR_SAMPLE_ID=MMETSP0811_2 /ASSEMBLY_ACC=CAM_ASM_000667 /LENGTH=64 /DNA_ID=CAMNT_0015471505 /DNA_START=69 /DNA_END=263 /DNA_ORIENTATION=-
MMGIADQSCHRKRKGRMSYHLKSACCTDVRVRLQTADSGLIDPMAPNSAAARWTEYHCAIPAAP